MSVQKLCRISLLLRHACFVQANRAILCGTNNRTYSVKTGMGGGKAAKLKGLTGKTRTFLDVEQDANKLVTSLVGGNIFKEGEEPKLKPDSEYPDWLWTLDTQPKRNVTIDDFEPDSQEYWDFLKMEARKQKHKRMQIKRRHHIF